MGQEVGQNQGEFGFLLSSPLQYCDSDCDEELIINIPFTGIVKLHSFCIIGGPEGSSPAKLKLFINQEGLDFDSAHERTPVQEFDLAQNLDGEIEYPVK